MLTGPHAALEPMDLEDREVDDDWTVGSQPSGADALGSSKVGALAAAAGRGASAFVEAFRSAVGTYRSGTSAGGAASGRRQ
jgi:hypothetical protein